MKRKKVTLHSSKKECNHILPNGDTHCLICKQFVSNELAQWRLDHLCESSKFLGLSFAD